jgi:hypothetical protein
VRAGRGGILRGTQEIGDAHDIVVGVGEGWIQLQCPQQHGDRLCLLCSGTTGCHLHHLDQIRRFRCVRKLSTLRGAMDKKMCGHQLRTWMQSKSRQYLSIYPEFPPMLCIVRFIPNSLLVNIQGSDNSVQNKNPGSMILKTEFWLKTLKEQQPSSNSVFCSLS